ncbi:MAG: ribosome hibernation-promoting factor, HPF/YfiA family [Vibrionaceae bacterium]
MKVEITGKNIEVTAAMRARVMARLSKLEKWQLTLLNSHAVITEEPNQKFKIEISVAVPGEVLLASAEESDMYAAINEAGQKLERQINKYAHRGEARRAEPKRPDIIRVDE